MATIGPGRGLAALGLALALVVGACGGASPTSKPVVSPGGSGGGGDGGGTSLTYGLYSNLDRLTSYRFTWTIAGSSSGTQASPGNSGSSTSSGVVINKPTRAIIVTSSDIWYIQIGAQEWTSLDGIDWIVFDADETVLSATLPSQSYATWFDAHRNGFKVAGEESKNGVQCVHYRGDSSLSGLYQGLTGVSSGFQADLWVARDGNYPVSGVYGFPGEANAQAASFSFSFDIDKINDPSNKITAPTSVIAVPT
ncbi:MAG: hypothetical protein ABSE70_08130 [Candidatus Limnocylindrales bacterium]